MTTLAIDIGGTKLAAALIDKTCALASVASYRPREQNAGCVT